MVVNFESVTSLHNWVGQNVDHSFSSFELALIWYCNGPDFQYSLFLCEIYHFTHMAYDAAHMCQAHCSFDISHHLDPLFNTGLVQCCKWLDRKHKCHLFCGPCWHVPASVTVNICMSAQMLRTRCTSCRHIDLSALFYTTGVSLFLVLIGILLSNKCSHWLHAKGFGEFVMQSLPRIVLCLPKLLIFWARDCSALKAAESCVCHGYL